MASRSSFLLRSLLVAAVALSSASLTGCGRHRREPLYASTVIVGDSVLVRVKHAYVKGDRVVVKTWMENRTEKPVTIDRDAIALRLDDGTVIPRASGRTSRHEPYLLAPGSGRDVHVDFRLGGRSPAVDQANLVIDGVTVGDEEPRMLGEVALASRHGVRRNVAKISAEEREAHAERQDAEAEEAEAEAEATAEEVEEAVEATDEAEEAAESWEIGAGR